jgi:hypothetical protein
MMSNSDLMANTCRMLLFMMSLLCVLIYCSLYRGDCQLYLGGEYVLDRSINISYYVMIFFSEVIARTSIPVSFIAVGYLVFKCTDKIDFNFYKNYRQTLLVLIVPYLVWNLISYFSIHHTLEFGFPLIKSLILSFGFYSLSFKTINLPSDAPIWFVRDIMGLILISPALFYMIKKLGFITMSSFFFFWFIGKGPIFISGFSSIALFFFSLGSFFAIKKIDINRLICYKNVLLIITIVFCILDVITLKLVPASDNMAYHQHYINIIHNVYLLTSSMAFLVWIAYYIGGNKLNNFRKFENSAFIIFAFPWIVLTPINTFFLKLYNVPYYITPGYELLIYVSVYILLVLLSLGLYYVLSKSKFTRIAFTGSY